jgi:hypothetical protein
MDVIAALFFYGSLMVARLRTSKPRLIAGRRRAF